MMIIEIKCRTIVAYFLISNFTFSQGDTRALKVTTLVLLRRPLSDFSISFKM